MTLSSNKGADDRDLRICAQLDPDESHHIVSEFNLISRSISASPIVSAFIVAGALITQLARGTAHTRYSSDRQHRVYD